MGLMKPERRDVGALLTLITLVGAPLLRGRACCVGQARSAL